MGLKVFLPELRERGWRSFRERPVAGRWQHYAERAPEQRSVLVRSTELGRRNSKNEFDQSFVEHRISILQTMVCAASGPIFKPRRKMSVFQKMADRRADGEGSPPSGTPQVFHLVSIEAGE
jgi:hypothetical protein